MNKLKANFDTINTNELLLALIEQIRLSSNLPKGLRPKKGISINGIMYNYTSLTPYAMKTDKNGYPYFLFYIGDAWVWLSAKYFDTEWLCDN